MTVKVACYENLQSWVCVALFAHSRLVVRQVILVRRLIDLVLCMRRRQELPVHSAFPFLEQ